jgi:hypothetical protein
LRDRIGAFETVVGNLQPILAQVPTFIEQAVMSADPSEEGVLLAEFEQVLDTPPLRPALEDMVAMDVEADLAEIRQPLQATPITPEQIEKLFTNSKIWQANQIFFETNGNRTWQLSYLNKTYSVTFYPDVFEEMPSLRLLNFGEPLFQKLLSIGSFS